VHGQQWIMLPGSKSYAHSVERVNQRIGDDEVLADDVEDCLALGEHEESCCQRRRGSAGECHDCHLRDVGEEEHECWGVQRHIVSCSS